MRLKSLAIALAMITAAESAPAQNNVAPPATGTPPPTKAEPSRTTTLPPPPVVAPAPAESEPAQNEVVEEAPAPEPAPPPPEPVTIDPDAAYPNGFADPEDPFGNDLSLAQTDGERGFDWGLLGLLGLLGLIPLLRGGGRTVRTVYVDRDDPRRVIREEETER